jgi:hypothetical protein
MTEMHPQIRELLRQALVGRTPAGQDVRISGPWALEEDSPPVVAVYMVSDRFELRTAMGSSSPVYLVVAEVAVELLIGEAHQPKDVDNLEDLVDQFRASALGAVLGSAALANLGVRIRPVRCEIDADATGARWTGLARILFEFEFDWAPDVTPAAGYPPAKTIKSDIGPEPGTATTPHVVDLIELPS